MLINGLKYVVHDVDVPSSSICIGLPAFFSSITPKQGTCTCALVRTCICTVRTTFCCFYPPAYSGGVLSRHRLSRRRFRRDIARDTIKLSHQTLVVGILLLNCFCKPLPLLQLVSPHVFCILAASCTTWTSSQTDSLPRMTTRRNWAIAIETRL